MDTAQFTNQLVMYSQVEQQLSTNDKLDSLISNQKQGGVQQLLGYMGYFVEAKTSNLALQSKNSYFNVTLADDASKLNIGIYDKDNKLVKSIQATGKKGTESFSWDGKDTNGVQLADGSYRITAVASRRDGTSVTSKVSTFGLVTGVDIDAQGKSVLKVNDVTINPDTVVSVRAPARNA
jgi:flagellar basal-body rod modification protein FlgD